MTSSTIGDLYGPAPSDLEILKTWLQSYGLSVDRVHPAGFVMELSGTAGQLRAAFHTEIHRYVIDGASYNANSVDPDLPSALAPLVVGFASLNNFPIHPSVIRGGTALYFQHPTDGTPQWTDPARGGGVLYALAPGDFKVQYDVGSLLSGASYTIGVIGESNVNLGLVNAYRSLFGLPYNEPQVVIDGGDPGQNGAALESYLDLEASGGVAPNATVILYTSDGSELLPGLYSAALRAVEDNVADVLSMSYLQCEQRLLLSNQLFYFLWQQAAAQGQTVSVSAGDGGAAGCDDFDTQLAAANGIAVNGFASTPYDVAVGGTDVYYDTTNEFSRYWNTASSTTPTTSLQRVVPEQAWDDPFGVNQNTEYRRGVGIVADSGGPSTCGNVSLVPGGGYVCAGGYAKPIWQAGPGVPQDGVRDLPDISLFSSGGANYSFWPICAAPSDCTTASPVTGATVVTQVGGTSAAAPAFAGIVALLDQAQNARQGQVNYLLYPLAVQVPSAFHDVTVGSNKVPCISGTPNCVRDPTTGGDDFGFDATPGYDMATGLGSLDVTTLIDNWNSLRFDKTTTSLSLSDVSIVHGTPVTVDVSVMPSSGGETPTGTIALTAKPIGTTLKEGITSFPLEGGEVEGVVQSLPGGSYTVSASYSGDMTYAASQSNSRMIAVTPEASSIHFSTSAVASYANRVVPYGTPLRIGAQPIASSGMSDGVPTGVVEFRDTASGGLLIPLSSVGIADWDVSNLTVGSHTVTASYDGDESFAATSVPTSMSFSVGRGNLSLKLIPSTTSVLTGGALSVSVFATGASPSDAIGPSGSVTVMLGSRQQSVILSQVLNEGIPGSLGVATFSNLGAATYTLSGAYGGDSNWLPAAAVATTVHVTQSGQTLPSSTSLTTAVSTVTEPNSQAILEITVQGNGSVVPTGKVSILDNGLALYTGTLGASGNTGSYSVAIDGYSLAVGTNDLIAVYSGDSHYSSSTSAILTIGANVGDFSVNVVDPVIRITAGKSGTGTIILTSAGLTGAVSLKCATSSFVISCSTSSTTATLSSSGQSVIGVVVSANNGSAHNRRPDHSLGGFSLSGCALLSVLFLWSPGKCSGRRIRAFLLIYLVGGLLIGCGEHGTPAGAYTVVVTANTGGITHDGRLTVIVE